MSRPYLVVTGVAAALIAVSATPASAATCNVSSAGVAFGSYNTLSSSPLGGVGDVRVSCDVSTTFTVKLSAGAGTINQRTLVAGTPRLNYNLYTDATRTTIWGDGISGSTVSATGTAVSLSIYGRIPPGQNVPAASYSDSITITISY